MRCLPEGSSSAGRASVSKTDGRGFESLLPCPDPHLRTGRPERQEKTVTDVTRRPQPRAEAHAEAHGRPERAGPAHARPAAGSPRHARSGSARCSTSARSATRCARSPGRSGPRSAASRSIVLVTVVIYTAYVGGLDSLFGVLSGWLYEADHERRPTHTTTEITTDDRIADDRDVDAPTVATRPRPTTRRDRRRRRPTTPTDGDAEPRSMRRSTSPRRCRADEDEPTRTSRGESARRRPVDPPGRLVRRAHAVGLREEGHRQPRTLASRA